MAKWINEHFKYEIFTTIWPRKQYAAIMIEWDNDSGKPVNLEWKGKQSRAQISEQFLWEHLDPLDSENLCIGDVIDLWGLLIELVEYNNPGWYWIVKRVS